MFHRLEEVGIGMDFVQKLHNAGLNTTEHLLQRTRDPKGLGQLAGITAISEPLLAKWVALANLMQVKGITKPYGDLLLASGVDSTEKLVTYAPADLVRKMEEQNKTKQMAPVVPTLADVEQWMNDLRTPEFATIK